MIDRRLCPPVPTTIIKPTTPYFTTPETTTTPWFTTTGTTPYFTTPETTTTPYFTTRPTTPYFTTRPTTTWFTTTGTTPYFTTRPTTPWFTTTGTTPYFTTTGTTPYFTTTGTTPFFTTTATTPFFTTTATDSIISNYSNVLTTNNEKIPNNNKYYQAIEILVNTSGYYTFNSVENIDGLGYLYQSYFDPSNPTYNLLAQDDQSGGNNQFSFKANLQAGVSYTLVFTTYQEGVTGPYAIVASGPDEVEFNSIENFQTTSTPIYFTSDYSNEFTSDYSDGVISKYSSELTLNSGFFARVGGSGSNFYYKAIQINVMTTGTYTFSSQTNTSEIIMDTTDSYTFTDQSYTSQSNVDTFGYIYQANFYPSSPTLNLLQQDDDGAGNRQFRLTGSLRSDITYVLVFTTYSGGIIGPFSIVASGPDNVIFNPISNK
jgi:hypothetical protein